MRKSGRQLRELNKGTLAWRRPRLTKSCGVDAASVFRQERKIIVIVIDIIAI
jgi:hypothetical protein